MASRRTPLPPEKDYPPQERIITPARPATNSSISPAVPTNVIVKLLTFTFLMVAAPISVYFLTARTVFAGNTTWAGATAAVTANVVLIGYIIVAIQEDQSEQAQKNKPTSKKAE